MLNRLDYTIRALAEKDLPQVLDWRNSDRIRSCMYTDSVIAWEDHYNWYQRTLDNPSSVNTICEFQGQPIGFLNANQIDRLNRRCIWGFYLGDLMAPKGSSYVMALLFLDYLFNELALTKICGEVMSFNIDSLNFHANLGFEQEGTLKEHIFRNNIYVDVVLFGLMMREWMQVRIRIENRLFGPKFTCDD